MMVAFEAEDQAAGETEGTGGLGGRQAPLKEGRAGLGALDLVQGERHLRIVPD
jgi:hypothetical protein